MMATSDTNADVKVREVLAVAKDLHAAQQQSMRLMERYKTLLGKLPGELWTGSGILHVVDAQRAVWCLAWNGGYPTVARVPAVDVNEAVGEPNEKSAREPQEMPSFPMVVYTEATEGTPVPADDAPAMWREAQDL